MWHHDPEINSLVQKALKKVMEKLALNRATLKEEAHLWKSFKERYLFPRTALTYFFV